MLDQEPWLINKSSSMTNRRTKKTAAFSLCACRGLDLRTGALCHKRHARDSQHSVLSDAASSFARSLTRRGHVSRCYNPFDLVFSNAKGGFMKKSLVVPFLLMTTFLNAEDKKANGSNTPPAPPAPPTIRKVHTENHVNGGNLVDDYRWLRDKANPEVAQYLEAENAYANAVMKPTT